MQIDFSITEFIKSFQPIIENRELNFWSIAFSILIPFLFWFIVDNILSKDLLSKRKERIKIFLIDSAITSGFSLLSLLLFNKNGILIGTCIGIIISHIIKKKYAEKKEKSNKEENNENHSIELNSSNNDNTTNTNTNNINLTNNVNLTNLPSESLIPLSYSPKVELPKDVSISDIDFLMVLEMYGYISQNQKFKMITSSILESSEEQIKKLFEMPALEEREYKEARAILNLIKLKREIVSKEDALKVIMQQEEQMKKEKGEYRNETD